MYECFRIIYIYVHVYIFILEFKVILRIISSFIKDRGGQMDQWLTALVDVSEDRVYFQHPHDASQP